MELLYLVVGIGLGYLIFRPKETEKEKAILELDHKTILAILEFITDSSKLNSLIDGTYRNPTTEDINRD